MDSRPAITRDGGESVRREKFNFDGGKFSGSRASGRRRKFTIEKCKQIKKIKNLNKKPIRVAADRLSYELKKYLVEELPATGEQVSDSGDQPLESEDDHPDFVELLIRAI